MERTKEKVIINRELTNMGIDTTLELERSMYIPSSVRAMAYKIKIDTGKVFRVNVLKDTIVVTRVS